MTDDLTTIAEMTKAPEGAAPLSGITILAYLDEEGDECLGLSTHGDATLTDRLGMLAWAGHKLMEDQ